MSGEENDLVDDNTNKDDNEEEHKVDEEEREEEPSEEGISTEETEAEWLDLWNWERERRERAARDRAEASGSGGILRYPRSDGEPKPSSKRVHWQDPIVEPMLPQQGNILLQPREPRVLTRMEVVVEEDDDEDEYEDVSELSLFDRVFFFVNEHRTNIIGVCGIILLVIALSLSRRS